MEDRLVRLCRMRRRGLPVLAVAIVLILGGCAGAGVGGDANALTHAGLVATDQGRYADAEPLLNRALAVRESTRGANDIAVADSLYNLGRVYWFSGRYGEAETAYRRAVAIREQRGGATDPVFAQYLTALGLVYQAEGRPAEADALYRRALGVEDGLSGGDAFVRSVTLNNLGYLYRSEGRYADAEPFYRRERDIREKMLAPTDPHIAEVLDNLGTLLRLEGRDAEAEPLLKRGLEIREAALGPVHVDVADSLTDLGDLYAAERRYGEADGALRRAVTIRETALGPEHPELATKTLSSQSLLYEQEGRVNDALDVSTRASEILERHLIRGTSVRTSPGAAEQALYRAAFLRTIDLGYRVAAPVAGGGRVLSDRGFEVAQLASASSAGQAVARMAARLASGSGALADEIRELQDLRDRRQILDASLVSALAGPTAGRDANAEAATRRELDATDTRIDELQRRITAAFPAYANLTSPRPVPAATIRQLLAPDEAMLVFVVTDDVTWVMVLRRDQAVIFRVELGAAALAAEVTALRARLDPWQNPDLQPFPATRAARLYQALLGPASAVLRGAHQILEVPDGALQSLPLGVLVTTPPRSDPVAIGDHRAIAWFARDHAVTVLPSVASLLALRSFASASRASLPFLGIGDPVLSGPSTPQHLDLPENAATTGPAGATDAGSGEQRRGLNVVLASRPSVRGGSLVRDGVVDVAAVRALPPLPETATELRIIAHTLGASSDDIYLGDRAREPLIARASLDRYRVVEFATHGLMSGDLGLGEPALVLTPPPVATADDNGLLTASRIATLRFDADWVVLSACNTAAGDGSPDGGGLSGLARAFFYAGARSLLVSHWSVPSLATVRLTTGAFVALEQDPAIGRAEAFRRSEMAMLADPNPPAFSHPLVWAPFILAGEGGPGR